MFFHVSKACSVLIAHEVDKNANPSIKPVAINVTPK